MPVVVIVSGLPAAGKSSLARRLSSDLSLALVSRDRLRSELGALSELVPAGQGWRVGRSLDLVINHFVHRLLDVGAGAVIDANFNWAPQAQAVRDLVAEREPSCVEVCLWADPSVLRARFAARNDPPLSEDLVPHVEAALARPRLPVLGPPARVVEFDTSDFSGLEAAYPSLVAELRSLARG